MCRLLIRLAQRLDNSRDDHTSRRLDCSTDVTKSSVTHQISMGNIFISTMNIFLTERPEQNRGIP
jgi:hypothetical protein